MKVCIPKKTAADLKESLLKGEITPEVIAKMLPEEKLALKALLEDFVSDKLGVSVSTDEISEINALSNKIDEAQKKLGDEFGNPNKEQETIDFLSAKKKMDDYLQAKLPAHNLRVLTGTIGRGTMLASIKSPILNIGSNIEIGFTEALSRRLANGVMKGTDNKLAIDYVKMVNKVYQKTGYDISRMTNISDSGIGGARVLEDIVHAQGPGIIRAYGRIVEDIVFKQLMGAPDVAFSSAHFADSVNLNSLEMAGGDKVKAREFMVDSMRLKPRTIEGEILRNQGILDAQKATWTDTNWANKVSGGIRKVFNDISGDIRLGDFLFPFVKTPASVIATGMDYAGLGIPKALVKAVKAFRSGEIDSKETLQGISRDLVRAGLGLVGALVIASQLDDEDFVGAYDPSRSQIETLRNSNYNSFRFNNKWVSTDWLGPLAVPFTAIMYARQYGKTPGEKMFQYVKGVGSQVKNLPGISDVYDYVKNQSYKKNQTLDEMYSESGSYIVDQASARLIPSFLPDVAKSTDKYNRVSNNSLTAVAAKFPGLRQTLPIEQNIFGEKSMAEPAWSIIIFGDRVKTDKENDIIKEINRVSIDNDKTIAFTDWDKSSSKTLAQFKEAKGESTFNSAKEAYGQTLKTRLEELVSSSKYKNMSSEDKLKEITSLDTKVINEIYKRYNFQYKKSLPSKK
jgi:hypothetical protein